MLGITLVQKKKVVDDATASISMAYRGATFTPGDDRISWQEARAYPNLVSTLKDKPECTIAAYLHLTGCVHPKIAASYEDACRVIIDCGSQVART